MNYCVAWCGVLTYYGPACSANRSHEKRAPIETMRSGWHTPWWETKFFSRPNNLPLISANDLSLFIFSSCGKASAEGKKDDCAHLCVICCATTANYLDRWANAFLRKLDLLSSRAGAALLHRSASAASLNGFMPRACLWCWLHKHCWNVCASLVTKSIFLRFFYGTWRIF